MGRQDIANYWDFPSKISRNCHKRLVLKISRHDQWEMFAKMSPRDRQVCFADFIGMNLLACRTPMAPFLFLPPPVRLRLPSPNCFLRVCLPTLFAAALKFFLPLTTSPISGTANSNKSAPTRFASGAIYLRKKGIAILPITCARAPNPRPRCRPTLYRMESLLLLKQPSCNGF